jgi:hypothetical protein
MIHLDAGADAVSGLADQISDGAAEFDLGGGVGFVAAFVFEALNVQAVARTVRQPAGQDEARHALRGARQRQEHVGVGDREEPFVADDRPGAVVVRLRGRLRLPQVGATLLFGHRHADRGAGLLGGADLTTVVARRADQRAPFRPARRIAAQHRDRRIGHADRAANAVLALIPHVRQRAARDLRAGTRIVPAQRMSLVADGERHQVVPGRMKIDAVDAVAESVVGAQLGQMPIGLAGELLHLRRADRPSGIMEFLLGPLRIEGAHDVLQKRVGAIDIIVGERGRLIENLVGGVAECFIGRGRTGAERAVRLGH